jgi:hypothetical protein
VSPTAELIADGGAAATGREFFRSRDFLEAEEATHTLRIDAGDGVAATPLIVRSVPGSDCVDAISPYGYPGFDAPAAMVLDPAEVDFSATGLVSVFVRHRLGTDPVLAGASERNIVQIADPTLDRKTRASDRQQIRRNERDGYTFDLVPGPEATEAQLANFLDAYTQTMRRTQAAQRYFYGAGYFARLLRSPLTRLALVRGPEGDIAAGSLVAESDEMLHYYLSGTADQHLRASPMKTIVNALVDLAEAENLPLNLGGGLTPGDALEEFKRGFSNRTEAWRTSEVVCDAAAYEELSGETDAGDFFPAYRG